MHFCFLKKKNTNSTQATWYFVFHFSKYAEFSFSVWMSGKACSSLFWSDLDVVWRILLHLDRNLGRFCRHSLTRPLTSWPLSLSFLPSTHHSSVISEKGAFILESDDLHKCIAVGTSNLTLEDCERPSRHMLWKWVSRHRLFNLGTSKCLGLNISHTTQSLSMFDCDTSHPLLWWRCRDNTLSGPSNWRLSVAGRLVIAKKNSYYRWKRYDTPQEGPCSYPFEGKCKGSCCS